MTNEANIDINIDDSAVDQLTRSLDALTRALNDTSGEFNQAERNADDLEKDLKDLKEQSDRTERSMAALGGATAGIAAGVVAIAGAIELAKISVEAFAETNETAAARLDILRNAGQELLGEFGRIVLGGDQFEETLEALTLIAEELTGFVNENSEALSELARGGIRLAVRAFFGLADGVLAVIQFYENLDENMGLLQASFLDLKVGVLEFAQDAERSIANFIASAIENFADLIDASDNVFEAIVDNPAFRAVFGFEEGEFEGPATFVANALRDAAQTIRGGEFDRFQDSIDNAALAAQELRAAAAATVSETGQLRENLRQTRDDSLDLLNNLDQVTARPIEIEVRGPGGGGAAERGPTPAEIAAQEAQNLQDLRAAATMFMVNLMLLRNELKLTEDQITESLGMSLDSVMDSLREFQGPRGEELLEYFGLDALRRQFTTFETNIIETLERTQTKVRMANEAIQREFAEALADVSPEEMAIHEKFQTESRLIEEELDRIVNNVSDMQREMEQALSMPGRIEGARGMFFSEEEVDLLDRQADLAFEYRRALRDYEYMTQNQALGLPIDTSELLLRRSGADFQDILNIDPVINSAKDLRYAFDELPDRIHNVAVEANMSFTDILKSINDTNAALRAAFSDAAFKGIENTFISLGQSIGDAFGTGLDEGESAGERAKKIAGKIFGQFLQVIGTTAIAQGLIISIGDPSIGGFPNPGRGAALIAAGTAAIATGAAISGKASKGKGSKGGSATTTGGGGGARNASTTTQIFIENQFGNRFDARELDRAAAQSFSRAAAAGQA